MSAYQDERRQAVDDLDEDAEDDLAGAEGIVHATSLGLIAWICLLCAIWLLLA